jgi:hypothetical protein
VLLVITVHTLDLHAEAYGLSLAAHTGLDGVCSLLCEGGHC